MMVAVQSSGIGYTDDEVVTDLVCGCPLIGNLPISGVSASELLPRDPPGSEEARLGYRKEAMP